MILKIKVWCGAHPVARWVYPSILLVTLVFALTSPLFKSGLCWLYIGLFVLTVYAFRPRSAAHDCTVAGSGRGMRVCTLLTALATMAACVLPMGALPAWNGEKPGHRNQYELMAEAILEGRIDFAYGDEDTLSGLENPYDPYERRDAGIWFHWDHAYYNGHYYMYFGVVPVFLLFIPYRLLTGEALTTYHATQVFAIFIIAGFFVLFRLLAERFFKKTPCSVYLWLSVAASVMSVWYATAEPALYCTAITGGLALELWSLYFFIRAVYVPAGENKQVALAGVGALLGALSFGCRPSIALANLLVIPMLAVFLRQRRFTLKLLSKLLLAALPYALVAAALMRYNYVRFGDPFEFGQAYQLTSADQTNYRITFDAATMRRVVAETAESFFLIPPLSAQFPYISPGGVFFNFPVLLLGLAMFAPRPFSALRRRRLAPLMAGIAVSVLVISAVDVMWTPFLLERYHMDIYFLLGLGLFLAVGSCYDGDAPRPSRALDSAVSVLSAAVIVSAFLFFVARTGVLYPEKVRAIGAFMGLL